MIKKIYHFLNGEWLEANERKALPNDQSISDGPSIIEHSFPFLGEVRVPLHNESRRIVALLDRLPNSGIQHLERLDHLGELRRVLRCGHHSRFEYVLLQLFLTHYLKQTANAVGLATSVECVDGTRISSAEELLKSWALLVECGHLMGTYEAERFVLGTLCSKPDFKNVFLDLFDAPAVKKVAERVIAEEDLGQIHRINAWLSINWSLSREGNPQRKADLSLARAALETLLLDAEPSSKIYRCKSYFQKIRRVAHIYLDSINLPSAVTLTPALLLQRIRRHPEVLLGDDDSSLVHLLDAIKESLLDEAYASPLAGAYKFERFVGLSQKLESKIKQRGAQYFIGSSEKLLRWLAQGRGSSFWGYEGKHQKWRPVIRLNFRPDGDFSRAPVRIFSEERSFNNRVASTHWAGLVTGYRTTVGIGSYLDVFENTENKTEREGYLATASVEHVKQCYSEHRKFRDLIDWLASEPLHSLFLALFRRFLPSDLYVRPVPESEFDEFAARCLESKRDRLKWSRNLAWQHRRMGLSKARRWESECVRREVRSAPVGRILLTTCNLIIEDKEHRSIAELDGAFLRFRQSKLELTVVEAKGAASGAQAKKALLVKLKKLGLKPDEAGQRIRIGKRSASAALTCDDNLNAKAFDAGGNRA